MPSLVPTAKNMRWALDILVVILSGAGAAASIPTMIEAGEFYGLNGDARGMILVLGVVGGVTTILSRLNTLFIPLAWKVYTDRLEFTFIAMLWICWTSATMSFSLFTLNQSTCYPSHPDYFLPSCPLLTFDLTLLHILSLSSFGQLLMILSSILSDLKVGSSGNGGIKDGGEEEGDGFVMWELALASPPSSPRIHPANPSSISTAPMTGLQSSDFGPSTTVNGIRTYGATSPSTPQVSTSYAQSQSEDLPSMPGTSMSETSGDARAGMRKDKFAAGRLGTYVPLAFCSLGVGCGGVASLRTGEFALSGVFLSTIAFAVLLLSIGCLSAHTVNIRELSASAAVEEGDERPRSSTRVRRQRAMEVGLAGILFVLWPVVAIGFTLFPPTLTRACSNPAASAIPSPGEDADPDAYPICHLSWGIITLSWIGTWILLVRLMGLVIPLSSLGTKGGRTGHQSLLDDGISGGSGSGSADGGRNEEARSLLGKKASASARSTNGTGNVGGKTKGWGRVMAGEEFELGSDDEGDN